MGYVFIYLIAEGVDAGTEAINTYVICILDYPDTIWREGEVAEIKVEQNWRGYSSLGPTSFDIADLFRNVNIFFEVGISGDI